MGSSYSVNLQVRFLEGWALAMAPGPLDLIRSSTHVDGNGVIRPCSPL
jgi:hypothetical protein